MARPIKTQSKDIQQSNYFTTAKYDYTLQEKIILYRVAEQAFEYREANKEWFKEHEGEYIAKDHVSFRLPITHFMLYIHMPHGNTSTPTARQKAQAC